MKITLNIDGPPRGTTHAKSPKPWIASAGAGSCGSDVRLSRRRAWRWFLEMERSDRPLHGACTGWMLFLRRADELNGRSCIA